ncbi:MAG TPA: sodium-dependent transporter [Terriglobales bacterium]|nr:sodium-dependent transporter [Terriglobales bacterium]
MFGKKASSLTGLFCTECRKIYGFSGYLLYDTGGLIFCYALFMILNIIIVMGGIKGGIEKFSVIAMPALAGILLFVIIYVAFQPGAGAGYAFMFKPDFRVLGTDFFGVLKTAAGQMFFSLSLGMGCMMTYGSYLDKKEDLQKNAFIIPAADTLMAIMTGMAVMPACAAFGIDYARGPGLLFVSMQQVFANMGSFGNMMGFLFYFLVFIAALTSSISLLEVCTTYQLDRNLDKGRDANRVAVTLGYAGVIFLIGLPVALDALGSGGATIKAPFELFNLAVKGWNDCWLDLYDMVSEGVMMPLGALLMSVLIGWVFKTKTIKEECELSGAKFRYETFFDVCFKYVVPAGMVVVLIGQLMDFFG